MEILKNVWQVGGAGFTAPDDAAVYKVTEDLALIFTTDFFTPVVDDPFSYGAVAAANAMSDVYAMGGKPLMCLNLVGFPSAKLGPEVLHQIVAGALSKIEEAGAVLAGTSTPPTLPVTRDHSGAPPGPTCPMPPCQTKP